jgi:hypothetical protein
MARRLSRDAMISFPENEAFKAVSLEKVAASKPTRRIRRQQRRILARTPSPTGLRPNPE